MAARSAKRAVAAAARLLPLRFVPLDTLLRLSQQLSALLAGAVYLRDWQLEARGRPQFFKHPINLSRWPFEPQRWAFTARGVYARQCMTRGCKVLDLCCGDGSISYLFFADIAGHIDAVDNDAYALSYARRYCASPNITFHRLDIVNRPLPASDYDVIVWNAAICYFDEAAIRQILTRIAAAGKASMSFTGMLPRANGWVDHKTEFADCASVERVLRNCFDSVTVREIDEGSAVQFYFHAAAPRRG